MSDKDYDFKQELAAVINKYSKENGSDTPDWVLAEFLVDCLAAWDITHRKRKAWENQ